MLTCLITIPSMPKLEQVYYKFHLDDALILIVKLLCSIVETLKKWRKRWQTCGDTENLFR